MSSPRYDWWPYAKGVIRRYPKLGALHESGAAGIVAEREYQAVCDAISFAMKHVDGQDRMRLIRLMYWMRTHNLEGAAQVLHISYRTARRWHVEFIQAVGVGLGLLDN